MSDEIRQRIERLELVQVIEHLQRVPSARDSVLAALRARLPVVMQPYQDKEGLFFVRPEAVPAQPAKEESAPQESEENGEARLARVLYEGWRKNQADDAAAIAKANSETAMCHHKSVPYVPPPWEKIGLEQVNWLAAASALRKRYVVKEKKEDDDGMG